MANHGRMKDDGDVTRTRRGRRGRRWLALGVALLAAAGPASPVGPASAQPPRTGAGAPDIAGGPWINSAPLTLSGLRGRVVLVEFWTYG
jgi:hypothetical protein